MTLRYNRRGYPTGILGVLLKPKVSVNVIVYQYGKVASTSLVATFNKMRGVQAYKCHFFGSKQFQSTVTRLCDPDINDYFFDHSLGQLNENLKAHRVYHRKGSPEGERRIVLTIAREPFAWFRSSLLQEINGHMPALRLSLGDRVAEAMTESEIVTQGLALLMQRLNLTLDAVDGNVDALGTAKRRELEHDIAFNSAEDFKGFLFLLSKFLRPHWWFRTQFAPEFGVNVADMVDEGQGLRSQRTERGSVYLALFEQLESAFAKLLELENLPPKRLKRFNEGHKKLLSEEVSTAFQTEAALALKVRTRSEITETLGYS